MLHRQKNSIRKTNGSIDLTNGPILRSLFHLAAFLTASAMLSTLYNITDMAWIGMLGSKAVAGVGIGGMYIWLSSGLVAMPRIGGQVMSAQSIGEEKPAVARAYERAALLISAALGAAFGVCSNLFGHQLIGFFMLEDRQTLTYAASYMSVTCGLVILPFMNLTLTGLSTARGNSMTPFFSNLAGLLLNMLLDPLLILGLAGLPRLETLGAALATVLAQLVSFVILAADYIRRSRRVDRQLRAGAPTRAICRQIIRIGLPSAIQNMVYCFISMVLTRLVGTFGAGAIATQRVGGQIEALSWNVTDGFASALNSFTAQNYGAGKGRRIRKGYDVSFYMLGIWGLLITALFLIIPRPIAGVFFHEPDVLLQAVDYLRIIGVSEAFLTIEVMTIGALSGLGRTRLCSLITVVLTGMRIPLAYAFVWLGFGLNGIWWAFTLTSAAKGILFYFVFKKISRRLPG